MVREEKVCCSTVHVLYYSSHLSGFFSAQDSTFLLFLTFILKRSKKKKNHIRSYASESVAIITLRIFFSNLQQGRKLLALLTNINSKFWIIRNYLRTEAEVVLLHRGCTWRPQTSHFCCWHSPGSFHSSECAAICRVRSGWGFASLLLHGVSPWCLWDFIVPRLMAVVGANSLVGHLLGWAAELVVSLPTIQVFIYLAGALAEVNELFVKHFEDEKLCKNVKYNYVWALECIMAVCLLVFKAVYNTLSMKALYEVKL